MSSKKMFFTFDMDWASDFVLDDFFSLITESGIKSTIHVTHNTALLDDFRKDRNVELGIHPNYNPLLLEGSNKNIRQVLQEIKEIVPEAVTVRSHALTSSSIIAREYSDIGIKYELNTYIPVKKGNVLYPFRAPIGNHTVIPFIYEDDISLLSQKNSIDFLLSNEFTAPRVFNFHPIHLFSYFKSRELYNCINRKRYGIRDFFVELVKKSKVEGWSSRIISEVKWD